MASCPSPRPPISAPGGYRLTWLFEVSFTTVSFSLGFHSPIPPTPEYLFDIAARGVSFIDGTGVASIRFNLAGMIVPPVVVAEELTSTLGASVTLPCEVPGGDPSLPLPNNMAALIHFRTVERGRNGRGQCWVGDIPLARVDANGVLNAPTKAGYLAAFNAFRVGAALPDLFLTQCVWSYCFDHAWRTVAVPFDVIGCDVSSRVHNRSRRLFGH
jgi:hypothetical protein